MSDTQQGGGSVPPAGHSGAGAAPMSRNAEGSKPAESQAQSKPAQAGVPTRENFKAWYEREMIPWLAQHQANQGELLASLKRRTIILIAIAIGFAVFVLLDWLDLFGTPLHAAIGTVIAVGLGVLGLVFQWVRSPMRQWGRTFRPKFLAKMCEFAGFSYNAQTPDSFLVPFTDTRIVPRFDRRYLTDYVTGSVDDVEAMLSDAKLEQRHEDDDGSHYDTVFHGLLASFTFPKSFSGRTVILADRTSIGRFFDGFNQQGDRVHLEEAPDFSAKYAVYATDQVEARYLLTPAFMTRFLDLDKVIAARRAPRIEAAFEGDRFLLTVHEHRDHFKSLALNADLSDPAEAEKVIDPILQIFDLVETLRLNQKTKV